MDGRGKFAAGLATAAVFILLEIAALSALKRASVLQDIWINRFSHRVMALTWSGAGSLREYFGLRKQNELLVGRNFELYKELQYYKELDSRRRSADVLDSASLQSRFTYTAAEIVDMGTNSRHNFVILDKGSADGVKPRSAIITPNGVVGMVYSVDEHFSYGLSLLNDRMSVSARIGRDGIVAPLCWDGKGTDHAILRDIPLHLEVPEGDTVRTSGLSSLYPADIPLGVTTGSRLIDRAVNVVDVKLFTDFARLRYVIIAENPERAVIENMEQ